VIHGMHDEQDLRRMGGLRRLMPITFATFLVGALAQAGIPPLAGFFAKDAVLEVAQHTGRAAVYALGSIAAFLSAFYLGRVLFLTFFGEPRSDRARGAHEAALVQPAKAGAWITAYILDARIIDGAVNAIGGGVKLLADGGRHLQTGFVRSYALAVFLGAVAILVYVGVRS